MDRENRIGLAPFGIRHSGEGAKGKGYFGKLPSKDGMISTEISTESDIGEHPLLVPTLTRKEIKHLKYFQAFKALYDTHFEPFVVKSGGELAVR